jgi:hypothetical protein
MASKLTLDQLVELEQCGSSPLLVENPRTHQGYVLVPSEAYRQAQPLFDAIIRRVQNSHEAHANETAPPTDWSDSMNERRCQLIDKKYDVGLSPAEQDELERLQRGLAKHQRDVAPRPQAILE